MKRPPHYLVLATGQRYPYEGRAPQLGEIIGGFVVRRIAKGNIYLALPKTPQEQRAYEAWERRRDPETNIKPRGYGT